MLLLSALHIRSCVCALACRVRQSVGAVVSFSTPDWWSGGVAAVFRIALSSLVHRKPLQLGRQHMWIAYAGDSAAAADLYAAARYVHACMLFEAGSSTRSK